jgi:hypothetical protein
MIPSSQYYREFIFIYYSYVTLYACLFPHNNIHTYIMYIFRVVSQYTSVRMTQFFYILIYSIHVKVYCYCLILNCYCPISNCYCLTLNCYCPISNYYCLTSNCYCLTLNRYCLTLNCYCLTLNCYCLNTHQIFNYI